MHSRDVLLKIIMKKYTYGHFLECIRFPHYRLKFTEILWNTARGASQAFCYPSTTNQIAALGRPKRGTKQEMAIRTPSCGVSDRNTIFGAIMWPAITGIRIKRCGYL